MWAHTWLHDYMRLYAGKVITSIFLFCGARILNTPSLSDFKVIHTISFVSIHQLDSSQAMLTQMAAKACSASLPGS